MGEEADRYAPGGDLWVKAMESCDELIIADGIEIQCRGGHAPDEPHDGQEFRADGSGEWIHARWTRKAGSTS